MIKVHRDKSFLHNVEIINTFRLFCKESYQNGDLVFEYTLNRNNTLYTKHDENDEIEAFYFTNWQEALIQFQEKEYECNYFGLLLIKLSSRGRGLAKQMFRFHKEDVYDYAIKNRKNIVFFGRTASVISFYGLTAIYDNLQPKLDGSFDKSFEQLIIDLRLKYNQPILKGFQNFFLSGTVGYRYNEINEQILEKAIEETKFTLFETLGIKESKGDRMLIFSLVNHENLQK
jgi:hypothetical protein